VVSKTPRGEHAADKGIDTRCRKPTGADGDPGTTTTLGHVLNTYGNMPNMTIADVLDIQGDYLCYEYAEA
jgi:hypothetical protein